MQILGAEKALFRALKTKGNTPKYGLIFHSTFIGRAKQRNKGRISRYLANKCSIASRIDCFMDVSTSAFGERMKEQVRGLNSLQNLSLSGLLFFFFPEEVEYSWWPTPFVAEYTDSYQTNHVTRYDHTRSTICL